MQFIPVKKKQAVKQRNMPISGPIRSDPVIRPDPVNTRTRIGDRKVSSWDLSPTGQKKAVFFSCSRQLTKGFRATQFTH